MSIKDDVLRFLQEHVGYVVTTDEIMQATGYKSSTIRRLRELRAGDAKRGTMGWDIRSHNDDQTLAPNEYKLASLEPILPANKPEFRLLGEVQRASAENQIEVYAWLRRRYGHLRDSDLNEIVDAD